MQWLQSVFGSDGSPVVQYVAIFAVIFAVLTVIVLVVRRLGGGGLADAKRGGQRGRQPRLGIVDVYELDRQRQLILLRRDNVEHLLLVGGPNDVVIERHIQRGQQRDPALRPETMAEPLAAPFAETLAEAGADPFSGLETQAQAAFRPDFSMPIVLAPTVSGPGGALASAAPLAVPPLDAGLLDDSELRSDRASEAIVTGTRPDAPARRPMRRTAPPLINPRPDVASERPRTEPAPPEPASPPVPVPGAIAPIPPLPPAERRPVDPAILSDMARQLEAALARPASAVAPARPAPPSFSDPVPVSAPAPEAPAAVDPMAAAMAAPVDAPLPQAEKPPAAPFAIPPVSVPAPAPVTAPKPEPFLPAPPPVEPMPPTPPAPVEPRVPAKPEPAPPPKAAEPAPAKSAPGKSAANPFSVEEIEAEFARLLGRPLDKRN